MDGTVFGHGIPSTSNIAALGTILVFLNFLTLIKNLYSLTNTETNTHTDRIKENNLLPYDLKL